MAETGNTDEEPSVTGLLSALEMIESGVKGSIEIALVPNSPLAASMLPILSERYPVHLIAPGEIPPSRTHAAFTKSVPQSAASLNVQPGRGDSPEDWSDCHIWLHSIADILLQIGAPVQENSPDIVPGKPTIYLTNSEITGDVSRFSPDAPVSDESFEKIISEISDRKPSFNSLEAVKSHASEKAKHHAPRARLYAASALLLNLSPSVIFGVGSAIKMAPGWLNLWGFAATLAAGIIAYLLSRLGAQRTWLTARALAEICRSLIASRGFLDPLFPPSAIHLPSFMSTARTFALFDCSCRTELPGTGATADLRDHYINERIKGQIRYYTNEGNKAKRLEKSLKRWFYMVSALAVIANSAAMLFYMNSLPFVSEEINDRWISGFGAWVFPSFAAALIGFLSIHEVSRRSTTYFELADQLRLRIPILSNLKSESSITEAVREIENQLLEEVAEWFRGRAF